LGEAREVRLQRGPDGHAELTIANPPGNQLDGRALDRLVELADVLRTAPPASLLVRGEGKAFCVGIDPSVFLDRDGDGSATLVGEAAVRDVARRFGLLLGALATLPCPTVAAIVGPALGGGLELALVCDVRVAAATATLAMPEVRLGVLPGGGATQRLPRLLGTARAKDLLLTGRRISGTEALAWGLVDHVVERPEVPDVARDEVRHLAASTAWRTARSLRGDEPQNLRTGSR
jgi:enoyl-CoA hydratase/carnithine racemase